MKKLLLTLSSFLVALSGYSAIKTFTGSGNFSTAALWNLGTLPVAGDNLRINGTCTFDNAAANLAYGTLTVGSTAAGTLNWPAGGTNTLNVTAVSSSINGSAINMSNGGTLQIRSSWVTANMTFTPGTGTINWNVTGGASSIPFSITTYNNLTITAGAQTVSNTNDLVVNNTLNITSGTFNIGANSLTNNTASGLTIITGTLYFPSNAGLKRFRNVVMNNGSTWTSAAGEMYTISGNFTMYGGLVDGSSTGRLRVFGNVDVLSGTNTWYRSRWQVFGTTTISGQLDITSITGNKTLNDVNITSTGVFNNTVPESWAITGNFTCTGTLIANTGLYDFTGVAKTLNGGPFSIPVVRFNGSSYTNNADFTVTSNFTGNGTFTQGATGILGVGVTDANFAINTFNASAAGNTVNYVLIANQNIRIPTDGAYSNLGCYGTGTKSVIAATTVNGNLDVTSQIDIGAFNFTNNGAASTATATGTILVSSATGTKTFRNVTLNAGGIWNNTAAETMVVNGNFSMNAATVTGTATGIFNVSGTFTVGAGTSTMGNSTWNVTGVSTINGQLDVTNINGTKTFIDFVNNGTWNNTVAETFAVIGNFTMNAATVTGTATGIYNVTGTFTVGAGTSTLGNSTWNVTGTSTVNGQLNITSTAGIKTLGNLTVNGNWNNTANEDFTVTGNLDVNGTFTSGSGIYSMTGAAKTITGTVAFTIQTIAVTGTYTNFANLSITTTLGSPGGTLSQGSTGILNIGVVNANFTLTTFNASAPANTVNYNRAGVQTVRVPNDGAYHHLTISGSGTKSLAGITNINGNLNISSVLDVTAANFAINLGGDWTNTGTFTAQSGTVTLVGTITQTITNAAGETFYNLICSGGGTKQLGGAITTNNDLTINSLLDVTAANYAVNVKRHWVNNGTFVPQNGTVTFNGAGINQNIGGTTVTTFTNVLLSNASGATLGSSANLTNTLTLSTGTFTVPGAFNFTLISNAARTARIAVIPAGADFAGNIIMQRYLASGPTYWRFLGSAVSGATIAQWSDDFATSGFTGATCNPSNCASPGCAATCNWPSIYRYNEATPGFYNNGFVAATNVTNSLVLGGGYWVYIGPVPLTFEVIGSPQKFSVSYPITYTPSTGPADDGWNLVCNPYPSSIDWDAVGWTKTGLNNAIYIMNAANGSFASYVGGFGVNGGSKNIASQQAFWVQANAGGALLSSTETVKTAVDATFLRETLSTQSSITNSITLTAIGNGNNTDQTIVHFAPGATNGFDAGYDAIKILNSNPALPNISSVLAPNDYSINGLPVLTSDISIPIRLLVPVTGTYTINRDSTLQLPASCCVLLEDLLTGITTDLKTTIGYSFSIYDTTNAPRFVLHISAPAQIQTVDATCFGNSTGMAVATGSGTPPWTYVWKDALGNILQTNTVSSSDTLFNLPNGSYSVEITSGSSICGTVTEPFTISQPAAIVASFTASTDTVDLSVNPNASFANASTGASAFAWDFGDGSPIDNSTNPVHAYTLAGTYVTMLVASDAAACSDSSYSTMVVIDSLMVTGAGGNLIQNFVQVYSWNSTAFVQFNFKETVNAKISIRNILGEKIIRDISLKAMQEKISIPLSASAKGVYFLTIETEKGILTRKIIHQ